MRKLGLDVKLKTPFSKVTQDQNSGLLTVHSENGDTVSAEKVLLALGRPPNVKGLGLEDLGVRVEKGAVVVDEYQNTTVPGIYAIGDVTN